MRSDSKNVRFVYGEKTEAGFKTLAFDDYSKEEADKHEEELKKANVDYMRINP